MLAITDGVHALHGRQPRRRQLRRQAARSRPAQPAEATAEARVPPSASRPTILEHTFVSRGRGGTRGKHQSRHHHRQPDRRSRALQPAQRHVGVQAAAGREPPLQGQLQRRVGREAQLLRRQGVGRAGRELRQLPVQGPPRRRRRPARVARVGVAGRRQAPGGRDRRRHRPVPGLARRRRRGRRPARRLPADRRAQARPRRRPSAAAAAPTTTSRSRRSEHGSEAQDSGTSPSRGAPTGGSTRRKPATSARTRSRRSTTRTTTSSGATCRRRARSGRGGSPEPAAGISARWRSRSSGPARWRSCPTPSTDHVSTLRAADSGSRRLAMPGGVRATMRRGAPGRETDEEGNGTAREPRRSCCRTSRSSAARATWSTSPPATCATTWARASWPCRRRRRSVAQVQRQEEHAPPARGPERRAGARDGAHAQPHRAHDQGAGPAPRTGCTARSPATDIADAIWKARRMRVDRRKVELDEPIKALGSLPRADHRVGRRPRHASR